MTQIQLAVDMQHWLSMGLTVQNSATLELRRSTAQNTSARRNHLQKAAHPPGFPTRRDEAQRYDQPQTSPVWAQRMHRT
jgi:hypothetical protein